MKFIKNIHRMFIALSFSLIFLQNVTNYIHLEILNPTTHIIGENYEEHINELAKRYLPIELPLMIVLSSMLSYVELVYDQESYDFQDEYLLKYSDDIMQRIHEEMNHTIMALSCQDL